MKVALENLRKSDVKIAFIIFTICCILSFFRNQQTEETVTAIIGGF